MMRYKLKKADIPLNTLVKEPNLQSLSDKRYKNNIVFLNTLLNNLILSGALD